MHITLQINALLLIALAVLHLYWAMGGTMFVTKVVPTQLDGSPIFKPEAVASFAVALGLLCFAYFHYAYFHSPGTMKVLSGIMLALGTIAFAVRAIGVGEYVGLRKTVKGTVFAKYDSMVYIPLCILISALAGLGIIFG